MDQHINNKDITDKVKSMTESDHEMRNFIYGLLEKECEGKQGIKKWCDQEFRKIAVQKKVGAG